MTSRSHGARSRRSLPRRDSNRLRWDIRCARPSRKMPEGDTIFRIARTLDAALAGKRRTPFENLLAKLERGYMKGVTGQPDRATGTKLTTEFSGDPKPCR